MEDGFHHMWGLNILLSCCSTTEKCAAAQATLLVDQLCLGTRRELEKAVPCESPVSCSGFTSHMLVFALCFLLLPIPAPLRRLLCMQAFSGTLVGGKGGQPTPTQGAVGGIPIVLSLAVPFGPSVCCQLSSEFQPPCSTI